MCKLIEDVANERAKNEKIKIASNLLALGTVSKEDIARATGLDLTKINEFAKQTVSALA